MTEKFPKKYQIRTKKSILLQQLIVNEFPSCVFAQPSPGTPSTWTAHDAFAQPPLCTRSASLVVAGAK